MDKRAIEIPTLPVLRLIGAIHPATGGELKNPPFWGIFLSYFN